jgi:hypothetical protein
LADTIATLHPDVLAVQEVGDPTALHDVAKTVGGYPHTATADPDGRGIRVGSLSKLPLLVVHRGATFPASLRPIQVDDAPATENAMGRSALGAGVTTARRDPHRPDHLPPEVEAAHFSRWSVLHRDEGRRARFAAYALYRRGAEAATVRAAATTLLVGRGQQCSYAKDLA